MQIAAFDLGDVGGRIALHMHIGDVGGIAAPHDAAGTEFLDHAAGEGDQTFIVRLALGHITQGRHLHDDARILGQVQHIAIFPDHARLGIAHMVDQHLATREGGDRATGIARIVGTEIQLDH